MRLDERCLGGRHSLELEAYNMRVKIVTAKSEVGCWLGGAPLRALTPRPASARAPRDVRASAREDPFQEVRETYRRVARLGNEPRRAKDCMSAPPKTLNLAAKLSENRLKKRAECDRTIPEHKRNIANMHRRIETLYSVTERKKNKFDAEMLEMYPSVLRRRQQPTPLGLERPVWNYGGGSKPGAPDAATASVRRPRPASAPPSRRPASAKSKAGRGAAVGEEDEVTLYTNIRHDIMDEVISQRLYDEEALQRLFTKFLRNNAANPRTRAAAERAVADLRTEMEVHPQGA